MKTNKLYSLMNLNCSKIFLISFLLICLFTDSACSQTEAERKEFYKNIIAKGETLIKSFNNLKRDIHGKVFTDEFDGYNNRSDFQCAYEIYLVNYFKNLEKFTSEFNRMNNFNRVPEMSFLKQMNAIQEKKLSLLSDGIKFYEEISTEINSKPIKRWEAKIIDNFVANSKLNSDFEMYKRLRPISYEIYLLIKLHENISYLKCSYNYWVFMLQNNFEDISLVNPLNNYNMLNHKLGFNNSTVDNLQNISNSSFDYSKIIFSDYTDNTVFSSWMDSNVVKNLSKNDKGLYSIEMANSNNSLSQVFLIKSLDFQNSVLNNLFNKSNLPIKECTFDRYKEEFNYNIHEYGSVLELLNNENVISFIKQEKELIKLLYSIIPDKSPWFYSDTKSDIYRDNVKKFDSEWFKVYELKRNLITASCYFNSISNDFLFNYLDTKILNEWFNKKMEANQLKAYYQNEYMNKLGKTDVKVWSADYVYLESVLKSLRLLNYILKDNFTSFKSSYITLMTADEFDKLLETFANSNVKKEDQAIISNNPEEIYYRDIYTKYKEGNKNSSDLNSLGWRCLINNQLEFAEKYFLEGLKIAKNDPMITLNLAHVVLFKGDYKKAKKLYTKFPMDQSIPELKMDVKSSIQMDFEEFIKNGKDPKIFEGIKKELGL